MSYQVKVGFKAISGPKVYELSGLLESLSSFQVKQLHIPGGYSLSFVGEDSAEILERTKAVLSVVLRVVDSESITVEPRKLDVSEDKRNCSDSEPQDKASFP